LSDSFHLRKWYFDCVSPKGDAAIIYLARLGWRSAVLDYSSLLLCHDGQVTTRTSMRRFKAFEDTSPEFDLALPSLRITASFRAQQPALSRTIYDGVHWTGLQPKSEASVIIDGLTLCGLGYVERLDLTVRPWRLPLNELHWGRFLSPDDALVWIDWRGSHEATVVIHNGRDIHADQICAEQLRFAPDSTLALDRRHTLRSGQLDDTVLPAAPVLARFFPRNLFGIRETKWCSRGTLTTPDHASTGWAIHEIVGWPS
jgi:hypothetical protein